MAGRHFGVYRILHEIASGGMGSVYLADRVDETFHQRVAIKIVRPEFADAELTWNDFARSGRFSLRWITPRSPVSSMAVAPTKACPIS